jgi:two-component system, chemotaxis family, protein-glutamate methylesterase/glutaminase
MSHALGQNPTLKQRPPWWSATIEAVAIGASAGAVEALSVLLPAIPAHSVVPIFIVVHVPAEQPNMLVPVFARKCQVPVKEAEDKEPVAPGTIYFAPADYHLLIESGPSLALSLDPPVRFSRPSIDVLFESAADVYRGGLLGAVLTGASSDGAAGLAAIVAAGGRALVEAPETALASAMPTAALGACPLARAISLAKLAATLSALAGGS